jgi:adenosylcobyric acid synthase
MARSIMIQGTGSGVGKSVLCAALCRIFFQDGLRVAPFKSQNMSLNSFVTKDGLEMARSQVVQAEAAGVEPSVEMNPLLLKPNSDTGCQVVLNGKAIGDYSARDYGIYQRRIWGVIEESFRSLSRNNDVIVIEGAGSPAEVNLKDRDFVNMRTAEMADAPVVLAADIDRGGAFASIVGTLELLEPRERARIKGFIINKFRGDLSLLAPGLDFLLQKTGIPVLGVVPFFRDVYIQEEDGVPLEESSKFGARSTESRSNIDVAVIHLPHISNFTDFDALAAEPGVRVRYVRSSAEINGADLVIVPGSKNTIGDLLFIRETGMERKIREFAAQGGMVAGICGGYQMLGRTISDPFLADGPVREAAGIGLLAVDTVMEKEKQTVQVTASSRASSWWDGDLEVTGYEIHLGRTERADGTGPAFRVRGEAGREDGAVSPEHRVWGTYIHGIFDGDAFRRNFLDGFRMRKGLEIPETGSYGRLKQEGFDRLAAIVRASLDMKKTYGILNGAKLQEGRTS